MSRGHARRQRPLGASELRAVDPDASLLVEMCSDPEYSLRWPNAGSVEWLRSHQVPAKAMTKSSAAAVAPLSVIRVDHTTKSHDKHFPSVCLSEEWSQRLMGSLSIDIDTAEEFLTEWELAAHTQWHRSCTVALTEAVPLRGHAGEAEAALYSQWLEVRQQRSKGTHLPWGVPLIPSLAVMESDPSELYFVPGGREEDEGVEKLEEEEGKRETDPEVLLAPYGSEKCCREQNVVHPWELNVSLEQTNPSTLGALQHEGDHDAHVVSQWALHDVPREALEAARGVLGLV